jgi:ATP-dependent DNA ligase
MVGDGTFGSGKHLGQVGTLSLYQFTPKGVPVYICEVGTGLTDQQKRDLADGTLYPICVKVVYNDRRYVSQGNNTNALQFPRVVELRTDKGPSECVNPELVTSS